MLGAIHKELSLQQTYLGVAKVTSIYLGGGTPSLLEVAEIGALVKQVQQIFPCDERLEITLEANPDDIHLEKLVALREVGINRISIGIQTFQDELLIYLNRTHNAAKALASLEMIVKAGFQNFNLDLIYAIPGQTEELLQKDLAMAMQFQPTHLSAYCLTIEPRTAFGQWLETGKIKAVEEEIAAKHFDLLVATLLAKGYDHYEVSNFSLPDYEAQHNTNYWKRGTYLGVGPGAHSYNGITRQHNLANNPLYIQSIEKSLIPSTVEVLEPRDHINEYIMTSLRTKWGCDMAFLKTNYQHDLKRKHPDYVEQLLARQLAYIAEEKLILTTAGKLLADQIAANFFVV